MDRPWRIHKLAHDFTLLDVWALDTPGDPEGLSRLAQVIAATDETLLANPAVRALFFVRVRLGQLVERRPATAPWSMRQRLPADLLQGQRGPDVITMVPFPSVYLTDVEWVAECSSRLVHMVQHVGWVRDETGRHTAQLATLVRPTSGFGEIYLLLISPFRRLVVGPSLARTIARDWRRAEG